MEPVSCAACESDAERGRDHSTALESSAQSALRYRDLSDAARWARACHPAYAGRLRFPVRLNDPPAVAENW
jgi:hypothetical protein